ncbi:MAG: hypothetical protein PHW56_07185, partial [Methanosarcinaceae archaeon]|nr:hypothetical protein [Methanosarcinaceae archaeon]
ICCSAQVFPSFLLSTPLFISYSGKAGSLWLPGQERLDKAKLRISSPYNVIRYIESFLSRLKQESGLSQKYVK